MSSRNETLIKAVLDETNMENYTPLSRNEQFLKDIITKKDQCTLKPISRIEEMYFNLHQKIKENSGGDPLKEFLDETKSSQFLFCGYSNYIGGWSTVWYRNLTYERLQKILSYDTTSSVTNMQGMFYYCVGLTSIPSFDTSLATNMSGMFNRCTNLVAIPQLNTSNVTNMNSMFYYCWSLTTIDITHMNITSTSDSSQFAYDCYALTKLIIRNMDTIPTLNSNAFTGCYHFTGEKSSTYNPQGLKDGRIYVPDDKVDELKAATNWSVYADIIVPLSTLVE